MKKYSFLSLLLFITATVFSQVSLTYENNALVPGDSVVSREILPVEPGNPGPDQVWDFSEIQFTGNNPVNYLPLVPADKNFNGSNYNILLDEFGYEYYFNLSKTRLEEVAFTFKGISLVYSDPVIKLKYPFTYGQSYTDLYAGVATYPDNKTKDISGDYTVSADAYGTLILPDGIHKNTLRLRIEKNGLQVNSCGPNVSNSIRYMWYAPGLRFPVLSTNSSEVRSPGRDPKITRTAFLNQQKIKAGTSVSGVNIVPDKDYAEVSAVVYPSPFNKILHYHYFLPQQMPVSVELYTMEGKNNITLIDNRLEAQGLHNGELDASVYTLNPGVYFLRFTFGKKMIVSKVVKLQ